MNASGTITMSMTELDRLRVVQAVCERRLKPGQAADRLALSVRQVERLVQRYQAAGVAGLVSGVIVLFVQNLAVCFEIT